MRSIRLALAVFVLLGSSSALLTPASAAPTVCSVLVSVDSSGIHARVSSTASATDGVSGTVAIQMPPGLKGSVTLFASTDTGWPVTVSPQTAQVQDGSSVVFIVTETVPAAEPAGPAGTVTVEARGSAAGVPCQSPSHDSAPVFVMPYLEVFSGWIPPASVQIDGEAGTAAFEIDVEVLSNAKIDISFNYRRDPGITVDAPATMALAASDGDPTFGNLSVSLQARGLPPGPHSVTIVVTASADELSTHVGLLGLTIYVPRGNASPVSPGLVLLGVLGLAGAAGLGLWWHRARVAQRALARFERLRPPK